MIQLKEITKENLNPILKLSVSKEQEDQVAPNGVSIAQGTYSELAWFRGIFWNDTAVGFVMLSLDHEKKEYWIWRYMIDKEHQRKGYGKAALLLVIDFMKTIPDIKEIILTYVPKEKNSADGFYKKLGFIDTGILEGHEVIMKFPIK